MLQEIKHKIGSTFSLTGTVKLPAGTWSATSSLAIKDGIKLTDFTVTLEVLDPVAQDGSTHSLLIETAAANTASWPENKILLCDITFTDQSGVKISSPSFIVKTERRISS